MSLIIPVAGLDESRDYLLFHAPGGGWRLAALAEQANLDLADMPVRIDITGGGEGQSSSAK